MHRLKRDIWKLGIPLTGLFFFLVLIVRVPVSAGAFAGTSGLVATGAVQATPTVDLTVTALAKEQLALQVQQLKNQNGNQSNWLANNSTALIAAVATVIVALFGILQWAITVRQAQDKDRKDREDERQKERDAQNKELRAQAEERFKTAVAALGDKKEGTQVGGAILLRSFLNPEDKEIYGRYYTQIFDLAVAYLRFPRTSSPSEDPDGIPQPPEDPNTPLSLTPLRQALTVVFREAYPLAQRMLIIGSYLHSLDAHGIQLDEAYLAGADLELAWMPEASLRGAELTIAKFREATLFAADLSEANLSEADLSGADLIGANLRNARLRESNLCGANLTKADLTEAKLSGADLTGANLSRTRLRDANLTRTNIEAALSLRSTDLRGVTGLSKTQLQACKAKGAIVDEDTLANAPQSTASPPAPS